jgi:hypothetical protein
MPFKAGGAFGHVYKINENFQITSEDSNLYSANGGGKNFINIERKLGMCSRLLVYYTGFMVCNLHRRINCSESE